MKTLQKKEWLIWQVRQTVVPLVAVAVNPLVMKIRNLLPSDWDSVKSIYEKGIATDNATFQTSAPSWEEWDSSHLGTCRVIAEENGSLLGWAALTPVSSRCVYAGVAEVSVYVHPEQSGKGIGLALLEALVTLSEAEGIWTLQTDIFPENSVAFASMKKQGSEPLALGRKLESRMGFGETRCFWKEEVIKSFDTRNYEENISAMHWEQLQEPDCRRLFKTFCWR